MAVYFIQAVNGGPVKIGHARNPRRRLTLLQTGNPERLRIIRVIEGGVEAEAQAHSTFADKRMSGEWFAFDEAMLCYGDQVAEPRGVEKGAFHSYLKAERGRVGWIAGVLGVRSSAVSQWTQVPAERVLDVERHTGISRHELRPDIYGPAPKKRRAA